ncbi:MAG: hypothetical protein ABI442_20085 [Gemmatimonadaceae bacterium]
MFKGTGSAQAYEGTAPTQQPVVVTYVGPVATTTKHVGAPKSILLVSPSTTTFAVTAFDARTQYSRLAISGAATLAEQINVFLNSGFVSTAGNTFTPVMYASHSGDFAAYRMAGGSWTTTAAGATAVSLVK